MTDGKKIHSAHSHLSVQGIKKVFKARGREARAVDGVDLDLAAGEIVGLVGESGSGKSTLGRMIAGLFRPDEGRVLYEGRPIAELTGDALKKFRREVQVVFQDPMRSLNPRMTAGQTIAEPFLIHGTGEAADANADVRTMPRKRNRGEAVMALLARVGLTAEHAKRFPRELSGGERQRVSIARAIALRPQLIVLDEAVSSLDVLVRAGILDLLLDLHLKDGVGYLFISHDLRVVRHLCDRVAVMSRGRIVEIGPTLKVVGQPSHEYTRTLLASSGLL